MVRKLCLTEQLIIPFGVRKWEINNINITQVSPDGTYLEGSIPFAYIDKRENRPLQIADFWDIVPDNFLSEFTRISPFFDTDQYNELSRKGIMEFERRFEIIRDYLKYRCETGSPYEKMFLDMYFDYWGRTTWESSELSIEHLSVQICPLLPLPQAHLYLEDGLTGQICMQKVDFAFWTGNKIIAIEIDSDRKPLPDVVRRDRRYRESGVEVVHILNSEIADLMASRMDLLPEELKSLKFVWKLPSRSPYIDGFDNNSDHI